MCQLCGITYGIGRNRSLSILIHLAVGSRRDNHLISQSHKERMPEWQQFIHGYYQNDLETLFKAVTPTAAAITNSKKNPGSSELKQTESLLKEVGASVYEAASGNITVA
jgi:hypothetical protein